MEIPASSKGSWDAHDNVDMEEIQMQVSTAMSNNRRYMDDPSAADDMEDEEADSFEDETAPVGSSSLSAPSSKYSHSSRKWKMILVCLLGLVAILASVPAVVKNLREASFSQSVTQFLVQHQISTEEALKDPTSPQYQALQWTTKQDVTSTKWTDDQADQFVQRYVMAVFFYALVPTSTASYFTSQVNLLSTQHHVCEWNSLWNHRTEKTQVTMGVQCNSEEHIQSIILPTMGLAGQVPSELAFLTNLTQLVLDVNHLTGTLPIIPSLTTLSLSHNDYDGSLPTELGHMDQLEELVLSANMWHGTIPSEIQNLSNLKRLAVNENSFTKGIHNLFHTTSLEEFYGAYNTFGDAFDNDSFQYLTNLQVLDLRSNKLDGPFPDALWTLPKLAVIDFHSNNLDGHLHEISETDHPVIQFMDVAENFLGGGLPTSLNKLGQLTYLDVSSNRFDDLLPDLSGMTNMESLFLTDNGAFGPQPIPTWLTAMSNLRHLSLKLTARTGSIPDWFAGNMTQLETLDLDMNHLSGTLPSNLGQLTNMKHLLLNRNWFHGSIPTAVTSLPDLETIMVDNNAFYGELVACQAKIVIADCGDPYDGCPDCNSKTQEVGCPCCSSCCYDENELCNLSDWLSSIMATKQANGELTYLDNYSPTEYTSQDVYDRAP